MGTARTRLKLRPGMGIVTLGAVCALVAVPPVASAGGAPPPPDRVFREGGLKYAKTRVAPSDVATGIEVPCGKRWRAVGGGADLVGATFPPAVYLLESQPFDLAPFEGGDADTNPDDGWGVFLREDAGPDLKLDAWAICAKRGGLRYRSATEDIAMNAGSSVNASCGGRQLLGGGFFVVPVLVTEASVSTPYDGGDRGARRDDGWTVHGFNHTAPSALVGAHAICSRAGALSYPRKTTPVTSNPTTRSPRVRCKGGAHVTAGGGSVGSGHIVESHPVDSGDRGRAPDDGWRATLFAGTGVSTAAYAVCRR